MMLARESSARLALIGCLTVLSLGPGPGCRRAKPPPAVATVKGRLISVNGRALAGATLMLLPRGELKRALPQVHSADDGTFVIAGVPAGQYLLRGELDGFSTAGVPVELAPGETVSTVLRLETKQLLEGVVQDAHGKPLGQAAIFAWPVGGGKIGVVEASSGADGKFVLAGLTPGPWTLMVEAPGFGTLRLESVDVPGRAMVLRLEGEARSLGGLVVAGKGAAQAEAKVVLGGPALPDRRQERTNGRGLYIFHGLGFGRFVLRASLDQQVSASQTVVIDESVGFLPPVKLTLVPGASLGGKVVDDRGQPLEGAEVELVAVPADDLPEIARTDRDGRFALGPVAPGRYQASTRLAGHAPALTPEMALRADLPTTIQIHLPRSARLVGQVVDEGGAPLVGAAVNAGTLGRTVQEVAVLPGTLPLAAEAANLPSDKLARQGRLRSTITDAQGRFVLADMAPGQFKVDIAAEGRLPLQKGPLTLVPGAAHDVGRLAVATGVPLSGRALDEGGAPVRGARVEARSSEPGAPTAIFSAVCDQEGHFSLQVPRGRFTITGHADRRAPDTREGVVIDPARPPAPLELRLSSADGVLEGAVRDPVGRPVARARISAFPAPAGVGPTDGGPPPVVASDRPPVATATTDGAGRFRMQGVPRAALLVEARHPSWPAQAAIAVPGQAPVSLQLPRPGGIEGEVRDRLSSAFVSNYHLEALGPDGRPAVDMRIQGAGFELRGLAPGKWRLKVTADGYDPTEREVDVPPGVGRNEPSLRDLRLELARKR
jgi:protocatechuate 3,4-dioxygenase beta subunit